MGKWIKYLLGLGILGFLLWYLTRHWHQLGELLRLSSKEVLILYLLTCLGTINNSRIVQLLVREFNSRLSLLDMVILQNATRLLNYVPMKFGTVFRANYLKRGHGLSYTNSANILVFQGLLTSLTAGLLGLAGIIAGYGLKEYEDKILALLFLIIFLIAILLLILPLPAPKGPGRIRTMLRNFLISRKNLSRNLNLSIFCITHLFVSFFLTAIRFMIIYRSLGFEIDFPGCLVLGAIGYGAVILGLTPGALGVREVLLGSASVVLGTSLQVGILAALVDRAIMLSWTFSVGGICTIWLWHKYPSDFKEKPAESFPGA